MIVLMMRPNRLGSHVLFASKLIRAQCGSETNRQPRLTRMDIAISLKYPS